MKKLILGFLASVMLMVSVLPAMAASYFEYYDYGRVVVEFTDYGRVKVHNNSPYNRRCYIYQNYSPYSWIDTTIAPGAYVWMDTTASIRYGCY
jgi:esterase/lipase superfamily enzyme